MNNIEFNPNFKKWLEDKNPTFLGIIWAIYWRSFAVGFIIGFTAELLK